jgi:hypothetical protein
VAVFSVRFTVGEEELLEDNVAPDRIRILASISGTPLPRVESQHGEEKAVRGQEEVQVGGIGVTEMANVADVVESTGCHVHM